jgi:hypothetical protein
LSNRYEAYNHKQDKRYKEHQYRTNNVRSDLYLDSKKIPYIRDLQIWKKAPIISKWVASRYNNNNNTKISSSQRLSEKRSKPPKATNKKARTEDKNTLSILCKTPPTG